MSDARDMLERAAHAATAGNFGSADELLRNATRIQGADGNLLDERRFSVR